jgi:hypothetical protein
MLDLFGRQLSPAVRPFNSQLPLPLIDLTKDKSVSVFFCDNMNTIYITEREGLSLIAKRICAFFL